MSDSAQAKPQQQKESIPETLISIIIALVLAFVFRGFVVEAFVIPTGSMAPTLMGKHMRFTSEETGATWQVGPWYYENGNPDRPLSLQGTPGPNNTVDVHGPMSGTLIEGIQEPLLSGDRILVLKFLYSIFGPNPFDVVVFKNPTDPTQNYIKRLIGLPGETIALVDGDVFVNDGETPPTKDSWAADGWTIRRKPPHVQRAVWQPVYSSSFATKSGIGSAPKTPWRGMPLADAPTNGTWSIGDRVYEYDGDTPGRLAFDQSQVRFRHNGRTQYWTIDDRYPYDESTRGRTPINYPVSDLRLSAGIEPVADGLALQARIKARGHVFQADFDGAGSCTLSIQPITDEVPNPVTMSETLDVKPFKASRVTNIELWHVDQSLQLWIDGKAKAQLEYDDWSPAQRFENSTNRPLDDALQRISNNPNPLANPGLYARPEVDWIFSESVRLHRVALDRDLHYRPAHYTERTSGYVNQPALATHPERNAVLYDDQFFVLGDNSPRSLDGRLWGDPHPWVAEQFEAAAEGVVPRDLMLGKAFFVYFPSLHKDNPVPVPDSGRLRFIR